MIYREFGKADRMKKIWLTIVHRSFMDTGIAILTAYQQGVALLGFLQQNLDDFHFVCMGAQLDP